MGSQSDLAKTLRRKIEKVKDISIRRAVLAAEFADMAPETFAQTLHEIITLAESGSTFYKDMLQSLGDFSEVIRRTGARKTAAVYRICFENGYDDAANALRRIPPNKKAEDRPEDVYVDPKYKDVSCGVKKTMGRIGDRDLVNRLLHDQNPDVVEQILSNPSLTEDQVIRIAAKRPTNGEALRRIGRSIRWTRNYRVRKALVFNPYTPTEIGISFLRLLMKQDVTAVARDENLHVELRLAARKLIKQSGSKPVKNGDGEK